MPVICYFHGIYISMYFLDTKRHFVPHIHVNFIEYEAVYSIPLGNKLDGFMPMKKEKLIKMWILLNEEQLMDNWSKAIKGLPLTSIEPLK